MKKMVKRENLVYETDKYVYIFKQYEIIRHFSKQPIFSGKFILDN